MSCPYFDWQKSCVSIGKYFYTRVVIGSCSMSFFGLQKNAVLEVSSRGDCRGTGRGQYLIVVTKREIWGNFIQGNFRVCWEIVFSLSDRCTAWALPPELELIYHAAWRIFPTPGIVVSSPARVSLHNPLTRIFFPFNCWHHDLNYNRCPSIFVYCTN